VSLAAQFLRRLFNFYSHFRSSPPPAQHSSHTYTLSESSVIVLHADFRHHTSGAFWLLGAPAGRRHPAAGSFPAHASFSPFYFALDWLFRSPQRRDGDERASRPSARPPCSSHPPMPLRFKQLMYMYSELPCRNHPWAFIKNAMFQKDELASCLYKITLFRIECYATTVT
jgi:hypothetical protein